MTVKPSRVKVEYPCLHEKVKCKDSTLPEFRGAVVRFERNSSRFFFDHPGADKSFAKKAITNAGNKLLNVSESLYKHDTGVHKCYLMLIYDVVKIWKSPRIRFPWTIQG